MTAATQDRILSHYGRCYGCGSENPNGLRLRVRWDGGRGFAEHVPPASSEGGPGIVHGGYLGTIADEMMALVASEAAGMPAMTKRLELDLRAPALTGQPLRIESWVEEAGGRHLVVRLEARSGSRERPCFEATGTFVVVEPDRWIRAAHRAGRGPEQVDSGGGDPSNFLRWQMRGALGTVLRRDRLERLIQIGVRIGDVQAGCWTLVAGPDGLSAEERALPRSHARFEGSFQDWQELIHHTVTLEQLEARGAVNVSGRRSALQRFIDAVDFEGATK